ERRLMPFRDGRGAIVSHPTVPSPEDLRSRFRTIAVGRCFGVQFIGPLPANSPGRARHRPVLN
ncbi:MAG: hypothetical protein ACK4XK_11680, partial [Casimicrobiaceae bacterium]